MTSEMQSHFNAWRTKTRSLSVIVCPPSDASFVLRIHMSSPSRARSLALRPSIANPESHFGQPLETLDQGSAQVQRPGLRPAGISRLAPKAGCIDLALCQY